MCRYSVALTLNIRSGRTIISNNKNYYVGTKKLVLLAKHDRCAYLEKRLTLNKTSAYIILKYVLNTLIMYY